MNNKNQKDQQLTINSIHKHNNTFSQNKKLLYNKLEQKVNETRTPPNRD